MTDVPVPAVAPVPAPIAFGPADLAALVRELAMAIHDQPVILQRHGITQAQFDQIEQAPVFQDMLAAATVAWASAGNTSERLKLEAAATLEDALPIISARMKDKSEGLNHVVEAAKLCARIAGLGEATADRTAGEKFSIVINLGDDQQLRFEKDVTPHGATPLPGNGEGAGDGGTLRAEHKGT